MSRNADAMTLKEARALLGVAPLASPAELRRGFREAAKRAHPDRAGGDEGAFRAVVEAYRRLQAEPDPRERFFQPPTVTPAAAGELAISPLTAYLGGNVDYALSPGRTIRIALPPGLRAGDTVRAGEAELKVVIRADGDTVVRGDDLWMTVAVAPRLLAEGGRLAIDTPVGRRIVWVTRKAGERGLVRMVGQGLPERGRHACGHLFVRLTPQKGEAQSAARALLRRFAAAWAA